MHSADLLVESFGRVRQLVHDVVDDAAPDHLLFRPDSQANSITWLVWHLTRGQDAQLADAAGTPELWVGAWAERFDPPFDARATGYGQDPEEAARLVAPAALLTGYHDAVHDETIGFVRGLTDGDLDRVVDEAWDPPVTLGVRLVSILTDDLEHLGQAAYLRGLAKRRS